MSEEPVEPIPLVTAENERRRRHPAVVVVLGAFEWAKSLSLAVIVFLVMKTFFVEPYKIPSGSMESTLMPGDFLFVNKLVYGAEVPFTGKRLPAVRQPGYGDVVVFKFPVDARKNFVKRLVGLPGDTLSMESGVLVRNGVAQIEPYVTRTEPLGDVGAEDFAWQRNFLVRRATGEATYRPSRDNWGPITVPPHHFFMLGDNRNDSQDSRYWGFVPDSLVRGEPMIVYYSYAPDSTIPFDWLTRVRWQRLGERVK
jgi:signal peptidase I